MNNTVREELYEALNDLLEKQFKDFKWWLKSIDHNGKRNIPTVSLETANQQEVVDLLIQYYEEEAPEVCIRVLKKSNINDVARKLEDTLQKAADAHQLPDSSAADAHQLPDSSDADAHQLPDSSDYRSYVKKKFQMIEDPNSTPGEYVSLNKRYSELIILDGQLSQLERKYEILAIGRVHTEISKRTESSAKIETLFNPNYGLIPQTVVLQGAAGIGKTTMAKKIMLNWASQDFYPDRFNYVFYIYCRELNLHTESEKSSIAEIISKQCPSGYAVENVIQNILKNEKKLLFIIDGFDEFRYSFDQSENYFCIDPWKKEPVRILLKSLFQKKLLPESSLIITTRPIALDTLHQCLEYPRFFQILGFSREKREEYFQNFFGKNKDQATQALRFVKQNDTLFTMCVIPLVSWIICTVMKQEMEEGIDLQKTPCTLTAIYMLYLSSLLKFHHKEAKQNVQRKLKSFCSLAAEGIWEQQILFREEDLKKHSLVQDDFFPLFLNQNIFKQDIHRIQTFSFIHLSFQEFFAALLYVLEDKKKWHSQNPNSNLKTLLRRHNIYFESDFAVGFRFLFGFLNEENRMKNLKKDFRCIISQRSKELLLDWVKENINRKIYSLDLNWITQDNHMLYLYNSFHIRIHFYLEKEILSYLYETQDENFVRNALCAITEINYHCHSDMELMILAYCIQHCQNLEYLYVRSPTSLYQADNGLFCPKNEVPSHLANLQTDWKPFIVDEEYMEHLLKSLTKLRNLKVLRFENLHFTQSCWRQLIQIFDTNQKLKELNLIFQVINHETMELLCEALQHPYCNVETLELNGKAMTGFCSWNLTEVFWRDQRLKELKLYLYNTDNTTVKSLCEGLQHPDCKVEKLWLSGEFVTKSCSRHVADLFRRSQTIKKLWLVLTYPNQPTFKMICEGLQDRDCKVEELCWHLAEVLRKNQRLTKLWLWVQSSDYRMVEILCAALQHPHCKMKKLCIHEGFLSTSSSSDFLGVLKRLTELQLFLYSLDEEVEEILCEGLQHPDCKIEKLRLEGEFLKESFCASFAKILKEETRLTELDLLSQNTNNRAVQMLCDGLKHPNCNIIKVGLGGTFLTDYFSSYLSDVFRKHRTLKELELFPINNINEVMEVLCKGLKHRDCKLKVLRVNGEYLKVLCGHSLSFGRQIAKIAKINRNLQELYLHGDCISDYDTNLLCEELKHSRHNLKELCLNGKYIIQDGEWMVVEHTTTAS
ncbi:NACHT, LRR and PYD domains-containing protein 3-like isoform X2 [Ahaetulla prasina]|uniref:NACHT, LRR and PYD domains-containing protein 3-like isoform X2 n=1 Tax=Ahaetulla prasina TaxID=499056 RepID=UPI002647CCB3|nr:NACHT, LRR and PYD domains-containing protein 3-like isoform X2 [Ahaetulla prasina]